MSDRLTGDDGNESLRGLLATPVGRRWLLKAGLGSALALGAEIYAGPVATAAAKVRRRGDDQRASVKTTLQFALGSTDGVTDLVMIGGGQSLTLERHTKSSRARLKAQGGLWQKADLEALTHYVQDVAVPTGRTQLVSVQGRRGRKNVLLAQMWHTPSEATVSLADLSKKRTGTLRHVTGDSRRLKELGLSAEKITTATEAAQLDLIGDSYQTATTLVMFHPNVSTVDPTAAATTKSLLGQTPEVQSLGTYITQMQRGGKDYATLETATDPDGGATQITVGDTTTSFQTVRLNDTDPRFKESLKSSLTGGITAVRDTDSLGAVIDKPLDEDPSASTKTWVQPQGVTPKPIPYTTAAAADSKIDIKVKDESFLAGTYTAVNGDYSGGKVPIKLDNNYVRWIWVYVQYLGADGKNLSANPDAKFPDTKYSKSVCIVPQVFTVLGIPFWDTNTVEFELEFPEGAHTARLLYCGMGSDIKGGGWRQYFPEDAYKDAIAPTDEVLAPALTTGLATLGLNVFALATDLDIAATWRKANGLFKDAYVTQEAMQAVVSPAANLARGELAAAAVVGGSASYLDIANSGQNVDNMWSVALDLASVLPKLIFNVKALGVWEDLGRVLLEEETADRLIDAIPMIGQGFAIFSAANDVATLAECAAETVIAPWVIENEVNLTYGAALTISRDPNSSTFPVSATSWRLDATIDGVAGLQSLTGTINEGGRIQSDPLVLDVTAPFGGKQLQWSFVLMNAAGKQVGTGVSAQLVNDDPSKPPSTVEFAIQQIPVAIDDKTVFERTDTVTYSPQAGGYTWSNAVTVSATAPSGGIQEISSTAVATLAGVAGMVWKESDKYYLRGVPVAQNANTIELAVPTKTSYARRPFLMLDPFVAAADRGNHVLLEPDDTTDGYYIRAVTLDAVTGKLTWDTSVSHGYFQTAVSAAALHSSGRVVAVNTDNGRLAWLQPVQTPRPALANYSAGPGTQIGLLSSPVALTVTNPGTVLVLEAGSSQLSAFDLNGNPIRYFGTGDTLEYTLPLVSDGTYLDVAVDGANNVYVLYFTGDGSLPNDYRVDVYDQHGTTIDTNSPGVNVPHLAVDYWRSIYGANFAALTDLGTNNPHVDPALGVAEPSLSRFDPS